MIVLGLDTATSDTAVGLLDTRTLELHVAHHVPAEGDRPGRSRQRRRRHASSEAQHPVASIRTVDGSGTAWIRPAMT